MSERKVHFGPMLLMTALDTPLILAGANYVLSKTIGVNCAQEIAERATQANNPTEVFAAVAPAVLLSLIIGTGTFKLKRYIASR